MSEQVRRGGSRPAAPVLGTGASGEFHAPTGTSWGPSPVAVHVVNGPDRVAAREPMVVRRRAPWVLLSVVLVGLVAGGLWLRWHEESWFGLTGDEPHYVTIGRAVWGHGSLQVDEAYGEEARPGGLFEGAPIRPGERITTTAHASRTDDDRWFSFHYPGIAVLVGGPYLLWGEAGARVAAIVVALLFVAMLGALAQQVVPRPWPGVAVTFAVACALPLLPAANQIYPEVAGGAISAAVVAALYLGPGRRPLWVDVGLSVLVAFQPWLHVKYALPAVIGAAALCVSNRSRPARLALTAVLALVGLGGLLAYNLRVFGNPRGPYSEGAVGDATQSVVAFLGLHLDRGHGMFVQNPLLLLGVFEALRASLRRRSWAVTALLLWAAFVVPNAGHSAMYGGLSFVGRFGWGAALVLMVPTVVCLGRMARAGSRWLLPLLVGAVVWQAVAVVPLFQHRVDLYNRFAGWSDQFVELWGAGSRWLPAWFSTEWAIDWTPNWVWTVAVAVVIAVCLLTPRRGLRLAVAVPAVVAVAVAVATQPEPRPPLVFAADELFTEAAARRDGMLLSPRSGAAELVASSPALGVAPGRYRVVITLRTDAGVPSGGWDVLSALRGEAPTVVSSEPLAPVLDNGWRRVSAVVRLDGGEDAELVSTVVRVFDDGIHPLAVRSVRLEHLGDRRP